MGTRGSTASVELCVKTQLAAAPSCSFKKRNHHSPSIPFAACDGAVAVGGRSPILRQGEERERETVGVAWLEGLLEAPTGRVVCREVLVLKGTLAMEEQAARPSPFVGVAGGHAAGVVSSRPCLGRSRWGSVHVVEPRAVWSGGVSTG